jgi:hypothetical protein
MNVFAVVAGVNLEVKKSIVAAVALNMKRFAMAAE